MGKIADLFVKLGLKNENFDKGIDKSKKKVSGFSAGLKKIGGVIAGAFAAQKLFDFTKDVVNLTAKAEGVEKAFNRIGGAEIFNDLRDATRGTVSNLELMRKTVSAKQLGVPIKNLAGLFEFATQRAADTGESVDFLVQSIVLGIGRKSPLILDNLGISAIALREKLGSVGLQTASVGDIAEAVGKIATEALSGIGDTATTTAQKMQRLSAQWDNLKVSIGKSGIVELLGGMTKELNRLIRMASTSDLEKALDPILGDIAIDGETPEKRLANITRQLEAQERARQNLISAEAAHANLRAKEFKDNKGIFDIKLVNKWAEARIKGNEDYKLLLQVIARLEEETKKSNIALTKKEEEGNKIKAETINGIKSEIEALEKLQGDASGENLANINKEIEALKLKKKELEELGTLASLKTDPLTAAAPIGGVSGGTFDQGGLAVGQNMADIIGAEDLAKEQAEILANQEDFNSAMNAAVQQFATETVIGFATALGQMFAGDTTGMEGFMDNMINTIGAFLTKIGSMLIAYSIAMIAFQLAGANPYVALAAGIALVAIGSAISSAAAAGPNGNTSGPITSIDTRSGNTQNASGSLQNIELQPIVVEVKGSIANNVIALSNKQGTKSLRL